MRLRVENTRAKGVILSDEERAFLIEYLQFTEEVWVDGKFAINTLDLFQKADDTFPPGLLELVHSAARDDGFEVLIDDARQLPAPTDRTADLSWLRPYQREALEIMLECARGIVEMPTASGKTELMFGLVRSVPIHWLLIVPGIDLLGQTAKRWMSRGGHMPGVIGDGDKLADPQKRLTISTFTSLATGIRNKDPMVLNLLHEVQGVLVDEVHCAAAAVWNAVLMRLRRAYYRIGFSATPLARGDRKSHLAVGSLGPIIHRVTAQQLIKDGVLSAPTIRMVRCEQDFSGSARWIYKPLIVKSRKRNVLLLDIIRRCKKPALAFVKEVKHGQALTDWIQKIGLRVEFAWGKKSGTERERITGLLDRGEIDVVVANVVFQQGVDIPTLESVVVGGAGKSAIATLQRLGRGMRTDQGRKMTFDVWDIMDDGGKVDPDGMHLVDATGKPLPHSLHTQALIRRRSYRKQGYEVQIMESLDEPKQMELIK